MKFAANLNLKGHQFFLTHPVVSHKRKAIEIKPIQYIVSQLIKDLCINNELNAL